MTRGGDGLHYRLNVDLGNLRDALITYLEDVDGGWYDMLSKEDFIQRVRIALDDLDESELGAMYDQYIREDDGPEPHDSSTTTTGEQ
jgi:hypothetical protein